MTLANRPQTGPPGALAVQAIDNLVQPVGKR
jgi:hypothetical protein